MTAGARRSSVTTDGGATDTASSDRASTARETVAGGPRPAWTHVPRPPARPDPVGGREALLTLLIASVGPVVRTVHLQSTLRGLTVLAIGVAATLVLARPIAVHWVIRTVVAITAGAAVLVVTGGRFTGLWVAMGLVIADWAVRGRAPFPFLPTAHRVSLALVVVLSLVAAWQGRAQARPLLVVVALAMSTVAIVVGSRFSARMEGTIRSVESAVALAVTRAGLAILFVPVVLLPWVTHRILRIDPLPHAPTTGTRWRSLRRHDTRPVEMWSSESAAVPAQGSARWRQRIGAPILTVALMVIGVVAVDKLIDVGSSVVPGSHANTDPGRTPAALADAAWYPEYQRDISWLWNTSVAWDPLAPVRLRDVNTRYINISDGVRATWSPPACACAPLRVWVYGGSTTFGLGQRDEGTTASYLARTAWDDGVALDIDNRGVVGDTHWEESQRFAWDLATLDPPDLVIFVDGINDGQAIDRLQSDTRQPLSFVTADFWQNYLATTEGVSMDSRWAPIGADDVGAAPAGASTPTTVSLHLHTPEETGALIAKRFGWARTISTDAAAAHGVPALYFWQPSIEYRPAIDGEPEPNGRDWALRTSRATIDRLEPGVIDITGALDGHDEPLYWDQYHTNEAGAELTARAMYPSVKALIEGGELPGSTGGP